MMMNEVLCMKKRLLPLLLAIFCLFCLSAFAEEEDDDSIVAPVEFALLKPGDASEDVRILQERLVSVGYLAEATGIYDESTEEAVRRVQQAYGLEETGEADDDTQEVIFGDCYLPLKLDDRNEQVRALQERLKELSVYSDAADGVFGLTTQQAVEMFQKMYGLTVTGEADTDTLALLYSDLSAAVLLPTATPAPAPGTITVDEADVVPFTKKLAYGSKGANVQKVQEKLKELGFFTYKKTTTGFYKNTQAAVKQFQEYNGLLVTGIVDKDTWNALFNSVDVVPADATPRPSPEPTPQPYFVDVDTRNQVTKVYTYDENKEYTVLVQVMICSTGTSKYPSDVGTWTLSGRTARWCTFPKWGGGTAQYWTKINENIAFHSVMFANYDTSKLNTKSFNNLGKKASHGCIRLTVTDAKWIYDNCGKGTQVYIHNDGNTDSELLAFAKYRKTHSSVMLPDTTGYNINAQPPEYRRLKSGSQGDDVTWLQMTLKELGYFESTVTGHYGPLTASAVKKFQRANGLNADGVLGEKTYKKLYEKQLAAAATATPVPADET